MSALYEKNDPRGYMYDPTRGAALGRPHRIPPETDASVRLYASRVQINSQGYDRLGTYWGGGRPLYWVHNEDASVELCIRADSRPEAIEKARQSIRKAQDEAR